MTPEQLMEKMADFDEAGELALKMCALFENKPVGDVAIALGFQLGFCALLDPNGTPEKSIELITSLARSIVEECSKEKVDEGANELRSSH
jgi:hypothetical protein